LKRLNSGTGLPGLDSARAAEALSGGTQPNETRTSQPSARQQRPHGLKESGDSTEQQTNLGSGSGRDGTGSAQEAKGDGTQPSAGSVD
jgi:hypothetical protein